MVGQQNVDIADTLHLKDVAMATMFGLSMGYFGYMIASDTLFDSKCGFSGSQLSDEDIAENECQGSLPWQPLFGFLYMG